MQQQANIVGARRRDIKQVVHLNGKMSCRLAGSSTTNSRMRLIARTTVVRIVSRSMTIAVGRCSGFRTINRQSKISCFSTPVYACVFYTPTVVIPESKFPLMRGWTRSGRGRVDQCSIKRIQRNTSLPPLAYSPQGENTLPVFDRTPPKGRIKSSVAKRRRGHFLLCVYC
jgi:hypothetical protein